jgi:putative YphP/YqiW family bacilliredoxin
MPYNPALVAPMREEMVRMGAQELTTIAEVDAALGDQKGSMLVFVNSVCGCAAGNARPALRLALEHSSISRAAPPWRSCGTARSCTSCIAT